MVVGRGMKIGDHPPVRGALRAVFDADAAAGLRDGAAAGVVALIRDPGAHYLNAYFDELAAVVCTLGTAHSHIGILTRAHGVPCVVGVRFPDGRPDDGTEVEVDCSGDDGVIRLVG
jgi:signal transduction protein with GAF and PtsI domain